MTLPDGWEALSYAKLEDEGVKMQCRYSISIPLKEVKRLKDLPFERGTRDGLGDWKFITVKSNESGILLFGIPFDGGDEYGASIWSSFNHSLEEMKQIICRFSGQDDFAILTAE